MASRTTDLSARWAPAGLLALTAVFVFLSAYQKQQWDSDIFWALKSGEWIAANLKVPDTDPFSYTFAGQPWVDFTWGFQLLVYLFYSNLGGWTGVFIFHAAVIALTFIFLYVALRTYLGDRPYVAACVLVVVYAAVHGRLFIRPHIFELFFVSLYFMLFALHEKKGSPLYLSLILPAQVLWINIHSSAVLGLFMAGAYAFGRLVDEVRARGVRNFDLDRGVVMPGVAALLAPVVSLANPYGLRLVIFPFVHNSVDNADAIRHINEWASPNLSELFFFASPVPVHHFAFLVIFAASAACLVLCAGRMRTWAYLLLAGAVYMAVSHVRWVPLFAVFGACVLAMGLGAAGDRLSGRAWFKTGIVALALAVSALLFHEFFRADGVYASSRGLGLRAGKYPEATVAYMKKEGLRGALFNEYIFGGYIIHEIPEVKVFIDGRTPTVYSPYHFWTARQAEENGRWSRLQDEYAFDMVLVMPESKLCGALFKDPRWAAVSFDDVSILFLRRDRYPQQASGAITLVSPCASGKALALPEAGQGLHEAVLELERVVSAGNGSARPRRLLGLAYAKGGEQAKAEALFKEAIAINEDAYAWYDLGVTLGKLKRRAEAIAAFKESVRLDSRFREGYLALGAAYGDDGDDARAIESLERYLVIADDEAAGLAFSTLGDSYFRTGQFEKAAVTFKRAAFMADDNGELADLYYKTGNSFMELGSYAEAAIWYGRAVKVKPDYANVVRELAASLARAGRQEAAGSLAHVPAAVGTPAPAK